MSGYIGGLPLARILQRIPDKTIQMYSSDFRKNRLYSLTFFFQRLGRVQH